MATESADLISAWHDLYVTLGTASATLIGLLFVAASLHLGDVVSNPGFRVRAYHINLYLLTLLVEAVVILVPQPVSFLGAELLVLNLVGLLLPLSTFYTFVYKQPDISHRGGVKTSGVVALSLAYLLGSRRHRPNQGISLGYVSCHGFIYRASCRSRAAHLVHHAGRRAIGEGGQ